MYATVKTCTCCLDVPTERRRRRRRQQSRDVEKVEQNDGGDAFDENAYLSGQVPIVSGQTKNLAPRGKALVLHKNVVHLA